MSIERTTYQKTVILKYLRSVYTHPTADEIFKNVKKVIPHISKGTVYRNLEHFSKKGIILEIPGDKKRFDACTDEHHHFVCNKCGKIFDLFFDLNLTNRNYNKIKKIGTINSFQTIFNGTCKECLNKRK